MGSCKYTEESLKLEHVPQGYGRKDKLARNEGEQGKFAWEHRLVSCLLSGKLNASTTGTVFVRRGFFLNGEGEGRQRVKGSPTPCFHPHSPSPPPLPLSSLRFTSATQATSCLSHVTYRKAREKCSSLNEPGLPESIDGVGESHVERNEEKPLILLLVLATLEKNAWNNARIIFLSFLFFFLVKY